MPLTEEPATEGVRLAAAPSPVRGPELPRAAQAIGSHAMRENGGGAADDDPWVHRGGRAGGKGRVLVVEDEIAIRESLGELLADEGYDVTFAENGAQGLNVLRSGGTLPDVIVLDLRMPVMDGWEFRAIQKDDPHLQFIPVVALSADRSAQAVTISAQAYLHKPLDVAKFLRIIERTLFETERRQLSARLEEAERLASLGRVAAGVGHEINNPLTFAVLNLNQALAKLRGMSLEGSTPDAAAEQPPSEGLVPPGSIGAITEMLTDCQVGLERIRQTVVNLQRLSRHGRGEQGPLDLRQVIEQSISMAWNQIRHRARLVRAFDQVPPIDGNAAALGQVFLNLLVNAAQSIPEGDAERHEIGVMVTARLDTVMVEIRDSGRGIPEDVLPHVFEPFFTTKPVGVGTGLGLSISHQTVIEHGGRIEVESHSGRGTVFRVILPAGTAAPPNPGGFERVGPSAPTVIRGRVLVIDDESSIGRVVSGVLAPEHDVVVVHCAADAFARLEAGERFDLVLCDLLMPVVSGPEVHAAIAARWPDVLPQLVFMTGGAFTPGAAAFLEKRLAPVLPKPFRLSDLTALIRERVGRRVARPPSP